LIDFTQPPQSFAWNGNNPLASNQDAARSTNLFGFNSGTRGWGNGANTQDNQLFSGLSDQVRGLNQRLGQFDSDNQQLLTEMAGLKQKLQAAGDYNYQLKQQLADSVSQLQLVQNEKRNIEQQLAGSPNRSTDPGWSQQSGTLAGSTQGAPTQLAGQLAGTATLRANNSLMQKVQQVQIQGVTTRMDGDVIRVDLPSDQLFVAGTYQITAPHGQILQQLAGIITREFPRQIVGIEAHWDNSPVQPPGTTRHQLTATQSLAVFNYLQRLGLPERQLFTMAMGSNRPRGVAGNPGDANLNRRVEIVIYPESYDAN
jgi:flagellar motor protein MotB